MCVRPSDLVLAVTEQVVIFSYTSNLVDNFFVVRVVAYKPMSKVILIGQKLIVIYTLSGPQR